MPSSTSSSRRLLLFALLSAALMLPLYVCFLIYAPTLDNRIREFVCGYDDHYRSYSPETVFFLRDNCLPVNLIDFPALGLPNHALNRQDHPADLLRLLDAHPIAPRKIVVLEDQHYVTLYSPLAAQRGANLEPHSVTYPPPAPGWERDWQRYQETRRSRARKTQRLLRDKVQEQGAAVAFSPTTLRQFASAWIDGLARAVVPNKSGNDDQSLYRFWRNMGLFAWGGDADHMVDAFKSFGGTKLMPETRAWLGETLGRLWTVDNPTPDQLRYDCHRRSQFLPRKRRAPSDPSEYDDYPFIRGLRQAQARGAEIILVFMPFNPEFEAGCAVWYEPIRRAQEKICQDLGWRFVDLRVSANPDLAALMPDQVKFFDDIHPHSFGNHKLIAALTARLAQALR